MHSREGAKSFAAFFFDVVNYSTVVTNGDAIRSISESSCSLCVNTAKDADEAGSSGLTPRGGAITVKDVEAPGGSPAAPVEMAVDVLVSREAGQLLDKSGSTVASNPADPQTIFNVVVRWEGDQWKVASVKAVG